MQPMSMSGPLYRQIKKSILSELKAGRFVVEQPLPSEQKLATEYGVSQGTIRKAIDELVAQNILFRHQGRGTFIRRHDESQSHFRFFNLVRQDGSRPVPTRHNLSQTNVKATPDQAQALGLEEGAELVEIVRTRAVDAEVVIYEWVYVQPTWFSVQAGQELPNTLYQLYAELGVNVTRASETISAVKATPEIAKALKVKSQTPLLEIARVAFDLNDQPIEFRRSLCRTDKVRYASSLG